MITVREVENRLFDWAPKELAESWDNVGHLVGEPGAENVYNVFDPVVTADHLELNYIKSIFNSYGSVAQQMTGSGSAVFGIMPSFEFAAVVCSMLKENYPDVFIAMPV